jgi:hypothetical protein
MRGGCKNTAKSSGVKKKREQRVVPQQVRQLSGPGCKIYILAVVLHIRKNSTVQYRYWR